MFFRLLKKNKIWRWGIAPKVSIIFMLKQDFQIILFEKTYVDWITSFFNYVMMIFTHNLLQFAHDLSAEIVTCIAGSRRMFLLAWTKGRACSASISQVKTKNFVIKGGSSSPSRLKQTT